MSASARRGDVPQAPPATSLPLGGAGAGTILPPARPAGDLFEGAAWTLVSVLTDAVALAAAVIAAARLAGAATPSTTALGLLAIVVAVTVLRMGARGMYGARPARMPLSDQLVLVFSSVGGAALLALAGAAIADATRVDVLTVTWAWCTATLALTAGRSLLWAARRHARRRGRSGKRTIIVGAGEIGAQLAERLIDTPELGLIPIGFVDGNPPQSGRFDVLPPLLGAPDRLDQIVVGTGAEHVIFAFTREPDSVVLPLLRRCQRLGIEVSVVPRLFENVNDRQWVEHVGGLPLIELRQTDPHGWQFAAKHASDRLIALVLVVLLAPVLALLALGTRASSPGPILFRQRRIGRDGTEFDILKFRSMRLAPKETDQVFQAKVARAGVAPGGVEGLDRRTPFGAFIRRTSLDELPQLLNVLMGHMSLVGPRPERPEFVEMFGEALNRYDDRHLVKSGITGWAQVHGLRGQTSLAERVEWDNWYIQNWSLWLDVKILFLTPLAVLRAPDEPRVTDTPTPGTAEADQPATLEARWKAS
ncbi:MAG: exopolysaccharide biosynthesis polyprenyl glycosylphosphotransferase [Solirubrobacteraceae bacterium]|nr:exopolysaccharide biosynthesis polyprenyl glycosylphosphotransferase [Solirubrobacteraceae bacterium]